MIHQNNQKKIRLYKERLNILLDIAQTINEEHSVDELVGEFETVLREELGVGKILAYTLGPKGWENLLTSGINKEENLNIDVERDLLQYTQIENITFNHPPQLKGFDSVIPLYHKYKIIGFVLIGDSDEDLAGISPTIKHLKLIQIISNLIIVFIENKRMQKVLWDQQSLKKEMELASRIQSGLIPSKESFPQSRHFSIAAFYQPQQGIGGDYFDIIRLSHYSIGFCIADVSGKGLSAAILMSNFQAVVRSMFNARISLKKLVTQLNNRVNESANNEKFITFFVGRYNQLTGKLEYVNAGHLPPIICDAKKEMLIHLEKGCIGLGMLDFIPTIESGSIYVTPGSRLLAFTDGLVEVENGNEIEDNMEEVTRIVSKSQSIEKTITEIKEMTSKMSLKDSIFDDITLLGLQFHSRGF